MTRLVAVTVFLFASCQRGPEQPAEDFSWLDDLQMHCLAEREISTLGPYEIVRWNLETQTCQRHCRHPETLEPYWSTLQYDGPIFGFDGYCPLGRDGAEEFDRGMNWKCDDECRADNCGRYVVGRCWVEEHHDEEKALCL